MTYWLDDNNWDCPTIYNRKWEEVDRLCVCEDDMRSFVVLNGKVYFSEYGQAHYGAIINGLLDIHRLKTVEQLEKKFKEDIDYIVDEVRYNDDGEGRIWDRWNLIQITGTNDYTSEQIYDMIAQQLGVPKESFNVLDYSRKQRLNDCPKIVKYNQLKKDIESVNESVGAVGDNVFDDYGVDYIVNAFKRNDRLWYPLINAASYQKATHEFVKYGKFIHFPEDLIDRWIGIVFRNAAILNTLSDIIGAGNGLNDMFDTFVDKLGGAYRQKWNSEYQSKLSNIEYDEDGSDENGYTEDGNILEMRYDFLEDIGYIGWSRMPDGSLGKTDFGMYDLFEVLEDYDDEMTPEQVFVIINRALDVTHQSGDMASIFIEGGESTLNKISNGGVVEKLSRSSFDMMIQESLSRVLNHSISFHLSSL